MIFAGVLALILLVILYKRIIPVLGVPSENRIQVDDAAIVDIRDYNVSSRLPAPGSTNIPVAYLNRGHKEISGKHVHVVADGIIEKNLGIRILRKKGYKVVSYTLLKPSNHKERVNVELRQSSKKPCETD